MLYDYILTDVVAVNQNHSFNIFPNSSGDRFKTSTCGFNNCFDNLLWYQIGKKECIVRLIFIIDKNLIVSKYYQSINVCGGQYTFII